MGAYQILLPRLFSDPSATKLSAFWELHRHMRLRHFKSYIFAKTQAEVVASVVFSSRVTQCGSIDEIHNRRLCGYFPFSGLPRKCGHPLYGIGTVCRTLHMWIRPFLFSGQMQSIKQIRYNHNTAILLQAPFASSESICRFGSDPANKQGNGCRHVWILRSFRIHSKPPASACKHVRWLQTK